MSVNIEKAFEKFDSNIKLTEKQDKDAKTKYNGVCKKLHDDIYPNIEYTGETKFLFGSYKNKTSIIPFTEDQDVDVLFKIPDEVFDRYNNYSNNGQGALLQYVKNILKENYPTTDKIKAWGKVVLVKFTENTHNVEVLPALEQEDGTFIIPNSEKGEWETFDPRKEIEIFQESNKLTSGITAKLIRFIKSWRNNNSTLELKSYKIEKYVINFLSGYSYDDKEIIQIVYDFFKNLENIIEESEKSFVSSAIGNLEKSFNYIEKGKEKEALEELGKIFGGKFPITIQKIYENDNDNDNELSKGVHIIIKGPKPWTLF